MGCSDSRIKLVGSVQLGMIQRISWPSMDVYFNHNFSLTFYCKDLNGFVCSRCVVSATYLAIYVIR